MRVRMMEWLTRSSSHHGGHTLDHHPPPATIERIRHRSLFSNSPPPLFFLAFVIICLLPLCSASVYIDERMLEPAAKFSDPEQLMLDLLAESGKILVDPSTPPQGLMWTPATHDDRLGRRQELGENAASSTKSTAVPPTVTVTKPASSSSEASTTATGIVAAGTDAASPLPSPFDSGFNSNITSSCSSFMTSMLQNSTFMDCLPISMLLQNSLSFFQAEKSVVRITQVLDAACSANVTTCGRVTAAFAKNITTDSACSSDLATGNPQITQAQLGLLAYKPTYTSTCLKNQETRSYCFAEAITNATNPADNYLYYLPLNISLPGGSQPTCNSCLQSTMAVYEASTSDRNSALASGYVNAAMQVNVNCGPNYVNASLAAAAVSGASPRLLISSNHFSLIALVFAIGALLL
ncbi:hypothetical protein BJ875DRAFT_440898 [Amylocarpus encephaloides]|uniref:DUF7729 domain-containing protein n=1 Tax=Amylocarpus encephaloides TaxID=45428 RepID=A0A9P7YKP3_9HELO|nr:hypothetical protein BJ875DRAFT_440898 [Amylocarpus encephaloides]